MQSQNDLKKQLGIQVLKLSDVLQLNNWIQMKNTCSVKSGNDWAHNLTMTFKLLQNKVALKVNNEISRGEPAWLNPSISLVSKQVEPYTLLGNVGIMGQDLGFSIQKDVPEGGSLGYSLGVNMSPESFSFDPNFMYNISNFVYLKFCT